MVVILCRFGVWELPGEGEQETPLQKYQRLQSEIKELFDEVSSLKVIYKYLEKIILIFKCIYESFT